MGRQHDPDVGHGRTCTSTDSTAGKSRTIGFQVSPESAEPPGPPPAGLPPPPPGAGLGTPQLRNPFGF